MELLLHTFDLALRNPFRITHGSRTVQPTLIVELKDEGLHGLGEATATKHYGLTIEGMRQTLEGLRDRIESTAIIKPEEYWQRMSDVLGDHPFEQCALDVAAHDLHARRLGQSLYRTWDLNLENLPLSNFTIGIGSIEEMRLRIREFPWPIYKIKLGTEYDFEIIKALREETTSPFRVDANTGWTAKQCIEIAPKLRELDVEFIEQPLPPDDMEGMKDVFAKTVLPIVADESCQREADVDRCHGLFHVINIKLMKCGGLTPARRMIDRARTLGMGVMVGCMTESTVGISAIAHLLPLLDYVDMDGPLLLREDIATGVSLKDGRVQFSDLPGTGAELLPSNA